MTFVTDIKEKEYTDFVINHEKSHFLQSYEWGQISKSKGLEPFYVGLKENDKLIATALLLKKKLPLHYSYFYIPRGYTLDYNNYELIKEFTKQIEKFTKKHNALFFKIDPDIKLHTIDKQANKIEGENNYKLVDNLKKIGFKRKKLNKFFEREQPRFTFRVMLDNEENIDKRYSKTAHRFIKKANTYQVETYIGTKEELKEFTRLMKLTEIRQNFFSHDDKYYEKFYDIFHKNDHVALMLAKISPEKIIKTLQEQLSKIDRKEIDIIKKKQEEIDFFQNRKDKKEIVVSAYLTVFYGNKAWYLYGANDMDYKMTLSNYKLFDFQIKQSYKRKIEIFDEFGTIGDVHTDNKLIGLHEFKKKFGGEYTEFIGEFDYIQKPFMNFLYSLIIPIRRKLVRYKLRKNMK